MIAKKVAFPVLVLAAALALVSSASAGPLAMCKADAERLCPGAHGKEAIECLKGHVDEVSIGCAKEVKALKAELGK